MNRPALKNAAKAAAVFAIVYGALVAADKAFAQAQAPAGVPPGASWTKGGAGGGPVTVPGQIVTNYAYPTLSQLPYKANPGAVLSVTGIAIATGLSAVGQPAAGGAIGGVVSFVGSKIPETSREKELATPVISQRQVGAMPPVIGVFGGGAIGGGGRVIKPMVQ